MSSSISSTTTTDEGMSQQDVINCESVREAVKNLVKETDEEKHFFVCDLADILTKSLVWNQNLPRVRPFYAVKSNPDLRVMRLMVTALGMGFECANMTEMALALSAGALASDIVYTCTQKPLSHLCYAADNQIGFMTFDCEEELLKIKKYYPNARLLLRHKTANANAVYELSVKFGCSVADAGPLLAYAKRLEMNVVGTVFHVGGLCDDPSAYTSAVESARLLFDKASKLGFAFNVLDIGGGFPGHKGSYKFYTEMCNVLNGQLEKYFSGSSVCVIAEVGNYPVNSAYTLCTTIIGRKKVPKSNINGTCVVENEAIQYYTNDGLYGSIKKDWLLYGGRMLCLTKGGVFVDKPKRVSTIWGYSACSDDRIMHSVSTPELDEGDHFVFENMGAYMLTMCSTFNGFQRPPVYYAYAQMSPDDDYRHVVNEDLPRDWRSFTKRIPFSEPFLPNGKSSTNDNRSGMGHQN